MVAGVVGEARSPGLWGKLGSPGESQSRYWQSQWGVSVAGESCRVSRDGRGESWLSHQEESRSCRGVARGLGKSGAHRNRRKPSFGGLA
jgi:hypothetical protein